MLNVHRPREAYNPMNSLSTKGAASFMGVLDGPQDGVEAGSGVANHQR